MVVASKLRREPSFSHGHQFGKQWLEVMGLAPCLGSGSLKCSPRWLGSDLGWGLKRHLAQQPAVVNALEELTLHSE